jgi:hypothetical protein
MAHEEFDPFRRTMEDEGQFSHENQTGINKGRDDKKLFGDERSYRTSYSILLPVLIWGVLVAPVVIVHKRIHALPVWLLWGWIAWAVLGALLWWRGSSNTLRDRIAPLGWKSEIIPEKLVYLSPKDFDGMRFDLNGEDDEDIENHRVRWATRYSKDRLRLAQLLALLVCGCFVGIFVWPEVTIPGSAAELPTVTNIQVYWLVVGLLLVPPALLVHLDWDYGRLMVTSNTFYDLKENPAWLPWKEGKNNPYPISSIWRVDPEDTKWGKLWGHGTIVIKIQEGMGGEMETLVFRRVPRHREFYKAVSSIVREQRGEDMVY